MNSRETFFVIKSKYVNKSFKPLMQKTGASESVILVWKTKRSAEAFLKKIGKIADDTFKIESENYGYLEELANKFTSSKHKVSLRILS